MSRPVHALILHAVGDPEVVNAGRVQLIAHASRDLAASPDVGDPEASGLCVLAAEREARFRAGMGEEGGVEIEAELPLAGPVDPSLEMLDPDRVAVHRRAPEFAVDGMEVQPVAAGDQGEGLLQVHSQLLRVARPARLAARDLDPAAAERRVRRFEAGQVVALPTVDGDGSRRQRSHRGLGVDTEIRIPLSGNCVGLLDHGLHRSSRSDSPYTENPVRSARSLRISGI